MIRDDANANAGHFIAGVMFRALQNSQWTFERVLTGKPSDGIVHGRAQFLFSHSDELLYQEQGKFTLTAQTPLESSQHYLYRYDEDNDRLSVYFIDGNHRSAALFHTLHFQPKLSPSVGWLANGEHLCSQDHYFASYLLAFNGVNLSRLQITYRVKGPAKAYISQTVFEPEAIEIHATS